MQNQNDHFLISIYPYLNALRINNLYSISSSSEWRYCQESTYQAKNTNFSQSMDPKNIILEPKSQTAYCFIHKAASSTWMKLFTNIHKDEKRFKAIIHFGQYYK